MKKLSLFIILFLSAFTYDESLPNSEQEKNAREIFNIVRCLTCSGQAIADSSADFSVNLRAEIRDMIKAGKTENQIKKQLTERYGEDIIMEPELSSENLFLWLFPGFFVVLAITTFYLIIRKTKVS